MNEDIIISVEKSIIKRENTIIRPVSEYSKHIHDYLKYLEQQSFPAPKAISINENEEIVSYVDGNVRSQGLWDNESLIEVAKLVRNLHDISENYIPVDNAKFKPWYLSDIGDEKRIVSHGDIIPGNIIFSTDNKTMTLIDWEFAGFVSSLTEFARVCMFFAQLYDDDIAIKRNLPPFNERTKIVRLMADVYGLTQEERLKLTDRIVEIAIIESAQEAIWNNITENSVGELWDQACLARRAAKIYCNRDILKKALK